MIATNRFTQDRANYYDLSASYEWMKTNDRYADSRSIEAQNTRFAAANPFLNMQIKVIRMERSEQWASPILDKILELQELSPNWDSYGAKPVSSNAVMTAIEFVLVYLRPTDLSPSIVPTCDGGIQLEWHTDRLDLEIGISPSSQTSLFASHGDSEDDFEVAHPLHIREAIELLREAVKQERKSKNVF